MIQGVTSAFLVLSLTCGFARFYIRFRVQRKTGWDDAFLVLGHCCLISAMTILYIFIDPLISTMHGPIPVEIHDLIPATFPSLYRVAAAVITLLWVSICCVKLSFLALFKELVRSMPLMIKFWWFALIFNLATAAYGVVAPLAGCPLFTTEAWNDHSKSVIKFRTTYACSDVAKNHAVIQLT